MINTEFIRHNILTSGLKLVSEKAILELLDHLEAAEKERDWNAERLEDAIEELTALRAKIEQTGKMREPLRRHHENAMGAGLDPSHSLTKLRVSAYQQTCLYADTVAALEESK